MKRELQKLNDKLFKQRVALAMANTDLDRLNNEFEMNKQGTVTTKTLIADVNQAFTQINKRLVNLR